MLEGLTDLAFPRDSGLCTRFATHITFKRTATTGISISIIPTANSHPDHQEKLKKYHQNLDTLDKATFVEVVEEASLIKSWLGSCFLAHGLICGQVHKLMGLKELDASDQGADTFSDDVLKIEICGPDQQHLSVIDVPGIFRNTTEGTTDADIEVVRNMVNHYMKNPR